MLESVKINLVTTEQEWEECRLFGATFDHELQPEHRQWPLWAIRDLSGKLISFIFIKTLPMAFCAWGPEIKPKQIVDAINNVKAWDHMQSKLEAREHGYVGVNLGNEKFPPQVMEKLGFDRIGIELYQAKE